MDVNWCLVCDKATTGGAYCSELCRRVDLAKSLRASPATSPSLPPFASSMTTLSPSSSPLALTPTSVFPALSARRQVAPVPVLSSAWDMAAPTSPTALSPLSPASSTASSAWSLSPRSPASTTAPSSVGSWTAMPHLSLGSSALPLAASAQPRQSSPAAQTAFVAPLRLR
ncbi:hypothetical protein AMAG_11507 [Allomyces macrogynus ATCC 38327]|uniref:Uncharacterized protein n=1 Tax=Allomyces macrogynus (strain ATCC 38327) TaxID=578462 RepID=A0A0L0SVI6_ALLM3|nr:hypothetical protein AMAG_11507 [Allomyces macrogynus ATCC 38327]|eukprot:KNE66364.1 hypothetical protein AMAG_11507 [Allomyces macrogynus ATCC 38327]